MGTYAKRSTATSTGTTAGAVVGGTIAIPGGAHIYAIGSIISTGTPATVKPLHASAKITGDKFHDMEPLEFPMPFSGSQLGTFTATPMSGYLDASGVIFVPVDIKIPSNVSTMTFNTDINLVAPPTTAGKFQFCFLYSMKGEAFYRGVPKHRGEGSGTGPITAGTKANVTEVLMDTATKITGLWALVSLVTPTATQDAQYIFDVSADTVNLGDQQFFGNVYPGATATSAVTPSGWIHYDVDIPIAGGATITGAFDCLTTITGVSKAQLIVEYI